MCLCMCFCAHVLLLAEVPMCCISSWFLWHVLAHMGVGAKSFLSVLAWLGIDSEVQQAACHDSYWQALDSVRNVWQSRCVKFPYNEHAWSGFRGGWCAFFFLRCQGKCSVGWQNSNLLDSWKTSVKTHQLSVELLPWLCNRIMAIGDLGRFRKGLLIWSCIWDCWMVGAPYGAHLPRMSMVCMFVFVSVSCHGSCNFNSCVTSWNSVGEASSGLQVKQWDNVYLLNYCLLNFC